MAARLRLCGQKEMLRLEINPGVVRSLKKVLLDVSGDTATRPPARFPMCPPMHSGDVSFREFGDGTSSTAHSDNSCSRF